MKRLAGANRRSWRARARGLVRDRRGVAAIEFALVAPLFLLFAFGLIEFSRLLWTDNALEYAAEQAARYALANPTASATQIRAVAVGQVPTVDPNAVTVTITYDTTNGVQFVTVTASTPFSPIVSIIPIGSLTLSGSSRMPIG
jgi:Flp pilus assembly protein TadG